MTLRSLLAGSGVLLVLGCGGDDGASRPVTYSPELRAEFVVACVAHGTPQDQCGCLYDRLEDDVPFARYDELDRSLREGDPDIPEDIAALAATCAVTPDD